MRRRISFRNIISLWCGLALAVSGYAQPLSAHPSATALINEGENVLRNDIAIRQFFERLYRLQSGDSGTVNILHIGDSHIQADFLTEVVRKNLQESFGNAGRGLVVPFRVAGTNEPFNFRTTGTGVWNAKRIIHPSKPLPIGIGGITINTDDEDNGFSVTMNDTETDYAFNRVTLFLANERQSYSLLVLDSLSAELARFKPAASGTGRDDVTLNLPGLYRHIRVRNFREEDIQSHTTLFGLSFENGSRGILYHAIGVNGARYEHYNKATDFARQTTLLNPDLIIVSLGTNESVEYPNLSNDFLNQVDRLITGLRENNPQTPLMLVTPPDAFIKKVRPNPGIEIIRDRILSYAVENGIAFWDMHKVVGGRGAAERWREAGMLRPDGIHFTRDGYALQGRLLYDAIMKSYARYVADRHP